MVNHDNLAVVLWFFLLIQSVKGKNGCRDLEYLPCIDNKTFKGHVINSLRIIAPGIPDCQNKCFNDNRCVSYNLGPVEGQTRTCELNELDHVSHPDSVIEQQGALYCPIMSKCKSNPCPGKVCMPDFAWDSYSCFDGWWDQWSPWSACCCLTRTRTRRCHNLFTNVTVSGCPGKDLESQVCVGNCIKALGMEDGTILDAQITASSVWNHAHCYASNARLNFSPSYYAWCALNNAAGEYIQIDLGAIKTVNKITTQPRLSGNIQSVTSYTIAYSDDKVDWVFYKMQNTSQPKVFIGNINNINKASNTFEPPFQAKHVRLIVTEYSGHPSLRLELYGC